MSGETRLSATELMAVLEQLPSGVVVVDRQARPLLTNHVARTLLSGLEQSQSLIDLSIAAGLRHAQTGALVSGTSTPLARALRGEAVSGEEYTLDRSRTRTAGVDQLRLRISGVPLRDQYGGITGAVSVFTDVTDEVAQVRRAARLFEVEQRARAETEQALAQLEQELAERRRAEEALQSSQQRLRLALEASRMGTWDYDVHLDRLEWSTEMGSIIGSLPEKTSGSLQDSLANVHPEDRAVVERRMRETLERGQELRLELRIVYGPSNRVRWVLARGRVYRDEHGRPLRMTGIAMDISERKEAEAARHSLARGERLRALGEMAGGIAHDLNQSLALIAGYSDMVRQELNQSVPEVERVREMIDITARAALEGGKALRGLLSFVRTQDFMAGIERMDAREALEDIARLTAPRWRDKSQAEGRPIRLEVIAEPGCWMNGSPAELREAITNLIFNAVDALPRGGAIWLRAWRQGEHVVIEVADSGAGMPPDVQARIFDPFFTTKGEQGTGLGLPQVLAIVEKHGGSIDVESSPGNGASFQLKFPRASAPATNGNPTPPTGPTLSPTPRRAIRVLVVEDEEQLARMARIVLSQHGHEVAVAASGDEAIERLAHEHFDLVISDLSLGAGKNGWDVAEVVRERLTTTRVVLVTGWGAAIDPREAQARGVHEVIAKPYRIAELRHVADRAADELARE